jgi:PAS domain S-box-containing protein
MTAREARARKATLPPPRTYPCLEGQRTKPTDYEVTTTSLLYYPTRGFEVQTPVGEHYAEYQQRGTLQSSNWEAFQDPAHTTYTSYVAERRDQEMLLDRLFAAPSTPLPPELEPLLGLLSALRFPLHGLQMTAAYVGALAPGGRISVAAAFQAADELRRIQRLCQWLARSGRPLPELDALGRELWQRAPALQPLRRGIEQLLVTYDFGAALFTLNGVVKPLFDRLWFEHLAMAARQHREEVLEKTLQSLADDGRGHEAWFVELARLLIADNPQNGRVMADRLRLARPAFSEALTALLGAWTRIWQSSGWVRTQARKRLEMAALSERDMVSGAVRGDDARFRLLADHAPVMLWMSGLDGVCEFFNSTWLEFTGRSLEQERGNGWAEGVHGEDFQDCMDRYLTSFVRREPFRIEYRLRRADGQYRWILDHGVPRYSEGGDFEGFIGSCIDITEMRESAEVLRARSNALAAALREREVLLSEIHHRVKNNLQLLSSMLALQARSAGPETQHALGEGQRRIDSIALVHEQLYGSRNLSAVNLARYTEALIPELWRASGVGERVAVTLDLTEVELGPERAIPCGLVVSELVTNVFKHAFPGGRRGNLSVTLQRQAPAQLCLTVADDGVGLHTEFPPRGGKSFGLDLVAIFAKQLDAEVVVERAAGTRFRLTFAEVAP